MASQPTLVSKDTHSGSDNDEKKKDVPFAESLIDSEKGDPDYGSGHDHIFANPTVAEHWRGVYERAKYEGRHRFDPEFTWTAAEEKRVRRKVRIIQIYLLRSILIDCAD